jgi:Fur family ferric uptake transcriptional regulator
MAVLERLLDGGHLSAEQLAGEVRARLGSVSTQAVYDVLRALVAAGLASRVEPTGSPARFEIRTGDNHHHVVCRACGATADVGCALGASPCLEPTSTAGFTIYRAEVTFWGLCPTCQPDPTQLLPTQITTETTPGPTE